MDPGTDHRFVLLNIHNIALHNLFIVMNQLELTVAEKLRLFDSLVGSVLNYNASVLGYHEAAKHIGLGNVWYKQRANNVNFQNIKQKDTLYI